MDEMNNTPVQSENENASTSEAENSAPAPEKKFCPHCGKQLPASAVFCGGCGANLATGARAYTAAPTDESPLKTIDYFLMLLLFSLPVVNLIMMCIWSFGGNTNVNRRNFSRAYLIWSVIAIVASTLLWIVIFAIAGFAAGIVESSAAYPYFGTIFNLF